MNSADQTLAEYYLADTRARMRGVKQLGEGALAQLPGPDWHTALAPEGNSAAVLIQHLAGNMHSRWRPLRHGFSAGAEGENAGRNRDSEFQETLQTSAELLVLWEAGWQVFLDALDNTLPDDLWRELTIRGETHTVLQAMQRQVAHYSGHVYQLILLVKTLCGVQWQTLSIPRGGSAAFHVTVLGQE